MRLQITDSEKDSMVSIIAESINRLKQHRVYDFTHLANLLYVYKKLTGENYEEVQDENHHI